MATLFFIMILLSVYHFVMESLILPTLKNEVRFKLNALRDNIRMLQITEKGKLPNALINDLEQAIVYTINNTDKFNYVEYKLFSKKFNADQSLREKAEKDIAAIEQSESIAVKRAFIKFNKYISLTFLLSVSSWILYILPIFLFLELCRFLVLGPVYKRKKNQKENLTFVMKGQSMYPNNDTVVHFGGRMGKMAASTSPYKRNYQLQ